jgi:hypothetical protein
MARLGCLQRLRIGGCCFSFVIGMLLLQSGQFRLLFCKIDLHLQNIFFIAMEVQAMTEAEVEGVVREVTEEEVRQATTLNSTGRAAKVLHDRSPF